MSKRQRKRVITLCIGDDEQDDELPTRRKANDDDDDDDDDYDDDDDDDDEIPARTRNNDLKDKKAKVEAVIKKISGCEILNKTFTCGEKDILVILDGKERKPWYKGGDICAILGYVKARNAIGAHVVNKYKKPYSDFKKIPGLRIDSKTIFISDTGLMQLLSQSQQEEAIILWEFITETILPELFSTGRYFLPAKPTDIERLTKSFYDDNMLSTYKDKLAIYLAYIGEYNGVHILKFGKSNDFVRRDLKEHRVMYKKFNVIKIWETMSNDLVEENIKYNFASKDMLTSLTKKELGINCKEKTKRELVRLTEVNDLDYCLVMIDNVVKTTVIPQEQEYKAKIEQMETAKNASKLEYENTHLKETIERLEKMNKRLEKMNDQQDETIKDLRNRKK